MIGDLGTGTGHFLSLLSKQYPQASLKGQDISAALFPDQDDLPPNVELSVADIKKPLPVEERGKYDVVHGQLLAAAMNPEDWATVVPNIVRMLKPGGALQWVECNFAWGRHVRGRDGATVTAARSVGSLFREALKDKFAHGWNTLPQIMKDSGLTQVDEDIVSSDRVVETREALTLNGMVACFDWARLMTERGMPGALPMEILRDMEAQAYRDVRSGCYIRFDIHVVVGFKPFKARL